MCSEFDKDLKKDFVNLVEAVNKVRELHKPFSKSEIICDCCACIYPCPTIEALDGKQWSPSQEFGYDGDFYTCEHGRAFGIRCSECDKKS